LTLHNWDEDLDNIMKRKMKSYTERRNDLMSDYNVNKTNNQYVPMILNDYNFSDSLNKYHLLIVDFWAPWCGPCKMVAPVIEQLSRELAGKITFGKLNVDENPRISNAFEIQSIPTMMVFKDGRPIDRIIGAMTKPQLLLRISRYIGEFSNSDSDNKLA
jgi:thioredoxin 1